MNGLGLCAGVGGLELGVILATGGAHRVACWVERDAHAVACLRARMAEGHFADAPIWDDLTTFDGKPWRGIDLLTAGAPCQPFSTASRGRRVAVDLLPDVLRVAREAEPWLVFVENVPGARGALRDLRDGLRDLGFCVPPLAEVSAAALGAPHERDRLWLFGYAHGHGERLRALNAEMAVLPPIAGFAPWRHEPPAEVLGVAHGSPVGLDTARRRRCGNGVVPAVAARAFRELTARALGGS